MIEDIIKECEDCDAILKFDGDVVYDYFIGLMPKSKKSRDSLTEQIDELEELPDITPNELLSYFKNSKFTFMLKRRVNVALKTLPFYKENKDAVAYALLFLQLMGLQYEVK